MKSVKLLLFLFTFLAILSSCRKNNSDSQAPVNIFNLKVPASFNWESSREVHLDVAVDFASQVGMLSRILVYDNDPLQGGNLLVSGSAGYNFPFDTKLKVPTALTKIYLLVTSGNGSTQQAEVNVSDNISYTFSSSKSGIKSGGSVNEPSCSSGCDVSVTGNSVTINGGKTYCITSNFSGTVNFEFWNGGGTLKICGATANISSINSFGGTNTAIIVTSGGILNVSNSFSMDGNAGITLYPSTHAHFNGGFNMNTAGSNLTNYSPDCTIGATFSPDGPVVNFGTISVNGDYNINGGSTLANAGTLNISQSFNANHDFTNTGTIEVQQSVNLNGNCVVENDCKFIVHQTLNSNTANFTMNNGYLKIYQTLNINASSIKLQNQSEVVALNIMLNGGFIGSGSKSSVKTTTATINGPKVNGPIEFATQSGTISNGGPSNFINGATLVSWANIQNYIPTGDCNPDGIGNNPGPTDTDGDGVPDNLDDYPNDATRAYNNYYPGKNQFGSLAFEDLWPGYGDYDMNDAVIDYNYWYVTNAQNKVVDLKPKFYLRAAGATLRNGFGFQLDGVAAAAVQSVTLTPANTLRNNYISLAANGVENNQPQAVVIVFDNWTNVAQAGSTGLYNTLKDVPYGISDTVFVNLHFATPQSQSAVGTPPYNPFLIKDMSRPVEIHLPDRVPTALADRSLFGTANDNSDPASGRYYKSSTNLPWGINIPVKFDYTWERVQILSGHLHFGTWAESGGVQYPDWYKNLAGYRDATNIYVKP